MIPLYDNNPRQGRPVVTLALIGVNVLVFLYQWSLPAEAARDFVLLHGMTPARMLDGAWAAEVGFPGRGWHTVFTSMFLHANLVHVLGNMWMLWLFGDNIEDRLGHLRYLLFYLACGLAAAAGHLLTSSGSPVPVVGASGAVAGVMGGYILLFPRARIVTVVLVVIFLDVVQIPAYLFLGFWFLLQVWSGAMSLGSPGGGGVAFWAHVGGFAAGLVLVRALQPRRRPAVARFRRRGPW